MSRKNGVGRQPIIRLLRLKPSTNSKSLKFRFQHSRKDRSDIRKPPMQRCPIRDQRKAGVNASFVHVLFFQMSIYAASVRLALVAVLGLLIRFNEQTPAHRSQR